MKLSPFEAPLFTSSKPYFFEQKGAQLAQPSFPPPSMQVFPRQPMQYLSKDSERYMTANGTVQKTKIHVSWSVFSPKTESSLLCRLGASRTPADVQRMETFSKLLVCSQEPKTKVLSCLTASKIKIFSKE